MNRHDTLPIVALGEAHLVEAFALGGADVAVADGPEAVRQAWEALPPNVVVLLTPAAADAVRELVVHDRAFGRLSVAMPG